MHGNSSTMSSAAEDYDNVSTESSSSGRMKQFMRNSSSLSTASSDFEFGSCSFPELNDEPAPLSPKLNYSPNYSANWQSVMSISRSLSKGKADNVSGDDQIRREFFNGDQEEFAGSRGGKFGDVISGNDQEISVISVNDQEISVINGNEQAISGNDQIKGEERKRVNLRSLLDRRDLGQLPFLSASSPSTPSPPASPASTHQYPDHSSHGSCSSSKFEDDHQEASTPKSRSYEKKSRKWAFNLDFLRRTVPSSRSDHHHLPQASSNDQADHYQLLHHTLHHHLNHCRIHEAASAQEARFDHQLAINHSIDHYSVAAAAPAGITNFESPRRSACSLSSINSSPKKEKELMVRAATKVSNSVSISPATSPPRSSTSGGGGDGGVFTLREPGAHNTPPTTKAPLNMEGGVHTRKGSPRWAPMSPHALHYEQQRARAEEMRRKTFLPYRQSLLGACFFPPSTPPTHQPHQPAVC